MIIKSKKTLFPWITAVSITAICVMFLACKKKRNTGDAIRLAGLKGPTTIGLVKLLDDNENNRTLNDYDFRMAVSADEITPAFIQGKLDVIAVPSNLAAVLYEKTGGNIQILAINTLGVLYLVGSEKNEKFTVSSLKNKTIYATGKGNIPEIALRQLLKQNGIEDSVNIVWKNEPAETISAIKADDKSLALIPEPFVSVVTSQNSDIKILLDLNKEWEKTTGESIVTGVTIAKKDFAEKNRKAVQNFLTDYSNSVKFVNAHTSEAAELVEKHGIIKKEIAEKAISRCNIVCITGQEMLKSASAFYSVLQKFDKRQTSGENPGEDFYFK